MPKLDRYQSPDVYEALAGDYVLGQMPIQARRRFQQLMDERPYIQQAVQRWEQRLNPLGVGMPEKKPPRRVWHKIKSEVAALEKRKQPERKRGVWESIRIWRTATVITAVLLMATLLVTNIIPRPPVPMMPSYVAVLANEENKPMFVAAANEKPMQMTVKMMKDVQMPSDKDFELWCQMKGSDKMHSMGVLAHNEETTFPLNETDWSTFNVTTSLAISVEPKGGSPTGNPTGPVRYKGEFVSLI